MLARSNRTYPPKFTWRWPAIYGVAALIPCLCIVSLACLYRQASLVDWQTTQTMKVNGRLMIEVSHVTRELQLERGLTAILAGSKGNPGLAESLARQQASTDVEIAGDFLKALGSSEIDPAAREAVKLALTQITQIRTDAARGLTDWREGFAAYSRLIQQALDSSSACVRAKTDRGIGKVFAKISLDQSARESLGQIRGMIAATAADNSPLLDTERDQITRHYQKAIGFLDSPMHQLGNGPRGEDFLKNERWQQLDILIRDALAMDVSRKIDSGLVKQQFNVASGVIDLIYQSELAELEALDSRLYQLESQVAAALKASAYWGVGGLLSVMIVMSMVWSCEKSRRRLLESEAIEAALVRDLSSQKFALDKHSIVSTTDVHGNITYANDKFCKLSGYTHKELIGQNHRLGKSDEHDEDFFAGLWNTISEGNVWHGEIKNRSKDGSHYWVDATIVPFKDGQGKITQYIAVRTDITELKEAHTKLRRAAEHDRLTGLPNRELFKKKLEEAILRAQADPDFKFAVLFFDFDRFKVINDSLGHSVGDALLIDIARQLKQVLHRDDTAARFGGDEFVVLLNDLKDYQEAYQDADRLLETFTKPHNLQGYSITNTASIGLVTSEQGYPSAGEMIRDADAAMYQAKEAGKARIVVFDQAMHERALDRLKLEIDLRSAISGDQFKLLYQPIIELSTGELSGFEALIRWDHPERGTVSPVDFIPIAEDTGLIIDIGRWVLHTASRQIAIWNRRLSPDRELSMNVNISKRQLLNPLLIDDVLRCQRQYGLKPHELKIEITESTIVDDRTDVVPLLRQLRELGFPIVMDDFGTGVSSLSTLHNYPIDVLKIDQAFIRVLDCDRSLLAVVASITSLADNLGIQTVAEGIESKDIVGALQSIDCTWGQGYHFAKPLDVVDAERYIFGLVGNRRSA